MTEDMLREYKKNLSEGIRDDFAGKKIPVIRSLKGYVTIKAVGDIADSTGARLAILGYPYVLNANRAAYMMGIAENFPDKRFILLIYDFGLVSPDRQEEMLSIVTEGPANLNVVVVLTAGNHGLPPRTQEMLNDASKFRMHDYDA